MEGTVEVMFGLEMHGGIFSRPHVDVDTDPGVARASAELIPVPRSMLCPEHATGDFWPKSTASSCPGGCIRSGPRPLA